MFHQDFAQYLRERYVCAYYSRERERERHTIVRRERDYSEERDGHAHLKRED
jgi:hypothetical protein